MIFDYIIWLSWDKDYIVVKNIFLEIKVGLKKLRVVVEEYEVIKGNYEVNGN